MTSTCRHCNQKLDLTRDGWADRTGLCAFVCTDDFDPKPHEPRATPNLIRFMQLELRYIMASV